MRCPKTLHTYDGCAHDAGSYWEAARIEAFLAEKPVVTTTDAGGPLEVVSDRTTGLVCEPRAEALAGACEWLRTHVEEARAWGRAGRELAQRVSWDATIEKLLV